MTDKIKIGKEGEETAAHFLEQEGYAIVARNYRFGTSEIDLIAEKGDWLVFVEVKLRTGLKFGPPEIFVNRIQRGSIRRAAGQYLHAKGWKGFVRFDVVAITRMGEREDVLHISDAFH